MNNQFPTKLILLRKHFNYSQQDLALKMNVSVEEYMSWENGSSLCSMSQLLRLSRIFKVSLDDLFDNTIEVKIPEEEIGNSIEIPFQTAINNFNSINETNTVEMPKNFDAYQTSDLDKTIITRIVSENQIEEVDAGETVVIKKPIINEKVIKKEVETKKISINPILIFSVASIVVLSTVFLWLINNKNKSSGFNSLGETNRLVAAQRFTAYLSSKGNIIKNGTSLDTTNFKDVVQISARQNIILGLNSDGTVVCGGNGCDVNDFKDVISISAGNNHALALTKDNTVLCSGSSVACNVGNFKNVSFIHAGNNDSYAISNGSVLYSGNSNYKSQIESISGVKALHTSSKYLVALTNSNNVKTVALDGSALLNTDKFSNIIQVAAGDSFIAGLNSNGTVSIVGDEKISNEVSKWTNIKYIAAYDNYIIGINSSNIIYGAGDNSYNQFEVIQATPTAKTEKTKLESVGAVSFSETEKSLILSWDAVKNAEYYQVSINLSGGYTVKTSTNSLTIDASKLTPNTEYMISIVSNSNKTDQFEASDVSVVNYRYTGKAIVKQHKVIFYDYDGKTIISEQLVDEGGNAVEPAPPTREGYTFKGWNGSFTNITKETKIYATYEKIVVMYTIKFFDNGGTNLVKELKVEAGGVVNPPAMQTKSNSEFKGWTPTLETIATRDVSYTAIYACTIADGILNANDTCSVSPTATPTTSPTTSSEPSGG